MGMGCLMLEFLKKLFLYTDPQKQPEEFKFPEEPEESARWDEFINSRKKPRNNEKSGQKSHGNNNDVTNRIINTIKLNNESTDSKRNQAVQLDVYNKLTNILKNSQGKSSRNETGDCSPEEDRYEQENRDEKEKNNEKESENKQGSSGNSDCKPGESSRNRPRIIKPIKIEDLVKNKKTDEKKRTGAEKQNDISDGKDDNTAEEKTAQDGGGSGISEDSNSNEKGNSNENNNNDLNLQYVSKSLDENIGYLENIYNLPTNKDLIIRKFNIAKRIPACLVYVDGMIDKIMVTQFMLPQLMDEHAFRHYEFECGCPLDYIEKNVLPVHQMVRMKSYDDIHPQIVSGLTALFIDGCEDCLIMETRGFERRNIAPPATETVIKGPQEGFTETLRTNITQIRRIVKSENLITEFEFISKKNNFLCAVMYMEGIANPKLVQEVKRRIKNLDVDYISGSGMLEQLIEDKSYMIFPQIITTERPDRTASFLMEGKVVIICEGTPFALAMPAVFFDFFHTSEDANLRWQYGTFLRIIRLIGIFLATFLPGMYTALILFHQEMIPTSLLSSIVATRINVPFPTLLEILLMEFSFELIREGGVRVPGVTGNTLGIIGALILGQAAVEAGLVSPILIIIVAVSGLGSFSIPNYSLSLAIRIIRISFIVFGQIAGFFGISVAFTILCAFALGMKSFGVPFFTPVVPVTRSNRDKIIRAPVSEQVSRPDWLNTRDERRTGDRPLGWKSGTGGAQN